MPTINSLLPPYPTFRDAQGNPLNGGFVYIGQPGLEARTTPKASFFDEGLTIPTGTASGAAVRTSAGYPVGHNGSPANVYVDGDYSITVMNSAGVMVFSSLYPTFALDTGAAVGPLLAPDGNLAAVGIGFTSDPNTGFIRPAEGQMQTVANGVLVSTATETGTVFAQPVSGAGFTAAVDARITGITTAQVAAGTLVTAAETIAANVNDTTIPTSAAVKGYADSVLLGTGQTWQNVSGSRTHSTSYQNTTGRTIVVNINADASSVNVQVSTDNATWITVGRIDVNSSVDHNCTIIVPPGNYYRINGVATILTWSELR
jgi:hypothetical protein